MTKHKKGDTIRYTFDDEPTEGTPIEASFSNGQCLSKCPNDKSPARLATRVGSLSCLRCGYYAGSSPIATATGGDERYGGTTHTRKIYCKLPPKD